jgi:HEAT repeat protein
MDPHDNEDMLPYTIGNHHSKAPPGNGTHDARIEKTLNFLGLNPSLLPLGNEKQMHLLLMQLKNPSWEVRAAALRTLERLHEPMQIQLIEDLLHDRHQHEAVRAAAASLLGKQRKETSVHALVAALHDPAWFVRAEVVLALGRMEQPAPIQELLVQLLNKYEHPTVRIVAIRVLVSRGYSIPVDILRSTLRSKDVPLREATMEAIGQLQGAVLTKDLYKLLQEVRLKDKENSIRTAAEHILRQMEEANPQQLWLIRNDGRKRVRNFRLLILCCWTAILGYLSLIAWNLYHLLYLSRAQRSGATLVEILSNVVPLGPLASFSHSPFVYILFALAFCLVVYSLIKATESAWRSPARDQRDGNRSRELWSIGALTTIPIERHHEIGNFHLQVCLGLILVVLLLLSICVSVLWDL